MKLKVKWNEKLKKSIKFSGVFQPPPAIYSNHGAN